MFQKPFKPLFLFMLGLLLFVYIPFSYAAVDAKAGEQPSSLAMQTSTPQLNSVNHIGGLAYAITSDNHIVYMNIGQKLFVFDTTQPNTPLVKQIIKLDTAIQDLTLIGDYLYVLHHKSITIFDKSNPINLTHVQDFTPHYHLFPFYKMLADTDALYLVARDELVVVDVSHPQNPHLVTTLNNYNITPDHQNTTLKIYNNILYVALKDTATTPNHLLWLVDVSNRLNPQRITTYQRVEAISDIAFDHLHHLAYMASTHLMTIFDVSNPNQILPVAVVPFPNLQLTSLTLEGHFLYASGKDLLTLDVSNPVNPQVVDRMMNIYTAGASHQGNLLYTANNHNGLWILDTTTPPTQLLATYDTLSWFASIRAIYKKSPFYAMAPSHIAVLEGTPILPEKLNNVPLADMDSLNDVLAENKYLHLMTSAGQSHYWQVYDLNQPTAPTFLTALPVDAQERFLMAVGNYLYTYPEGQFNIKIWNVDQRYDPFVVGDWSSREENLIEAIVFDRYIAYLQTERAGSTYLNVFDMSNPLEPQILAILQVGNFVGGVMAADGQTIYIQAEDNIFVVDISTLSAPQNLSTYQLSFPADSFAVQGPYLYALLNNSSAGEDIFEVVDVSNPAHLQQLFVQSYPEIAEVSPCQLQVHQDFLYRQCGAYGMDVYQMTP